MDNLMLSRIKQVMSVKRISVLKLSKLSGIPQSTLQGQLSGKASIAASTIESLLFHMPDVSAEWLIRGKEPMFITVRPSFSTINDYSNHRTGHNITGGEATTESVSPSTIEALLKQNAELISIIKNQQ